MFYERLSRQGTVGHWPGVGWPRVRTPKRKTETLGPSSSPPVANSDQTVTIKGISPISGRPCHTHARCLPRHQKNSRACFRRLSPSISPLSAPLIILSPVHQPSHSPSAATSVPSASVNASSFRQNKHRPRPNNTHTLVAPEGHHEPRSSLPATSTTDTTVTLSRVPLIVHHVTHPLIIVVVRTPRLLLAVCGSPWPCHRRTTITADPLQYTVTAVATALSTLAWVLLRPHDWMSPRDHGLVLAICGNTAGPSGAAAASSHVTRNALNTRAHRPPVIG